MYSKPEYKTKHGSKVNGLFQGFASMVTGGEAGLSFRDFRKEVDEDGGNRYSGNNREVIFTAELGS